MLSSTTYPESIGKSVTRENHFYKLVFLLMVTQYVLPSGTSKIVVQQKT